MTTLRLVPSGLRWMKIPAREGDAESRPPFRSYHTAASPVFAVVTPLTAVPSPMKVNDTVPSSANWMLVIGFDILYSKAALALKRVAAGVVSSVKLCIDTPV